MTLSRSTPLRRKTRLGYGDPPTCDFERAEDGHPAGGTRYVCPSCEVPWFVYGAGSPPEDRPCPQMRQTGGPKPVSDRRDEKRRVRGVRGPLQAFVRRRRCEVPGCQLQGEPAHYRTVSAGHGDWEQVGDPETGVHWIGRIGPLCPGHHRKYDGEVGGGSGEAFEKRHGIDFERICAEWGGRFADAHDLDLTAREHPYEQMGWR